MTPIPQIDPWAPSNAHAAETLAWLEWLLGLGPQPNIAPVRRTTRSSAPVHVEPVLSQRRDATPEERRAGWREAKRKQREEPAYLAYEAERARIRLAPTRKGRSAPLTEDEALERRRAKYAALSPEEQERIRAHARDEQRKRRAAMDREALRERWRIDQQAKRDRARRAA